MTIEEKAKAYDEALEIAKGLYAKDAPDSLHLERMFPALAESEDEKIRKGLIDYFENLASNKDYCVDKNRTLSVSSIISYLEKQGEHKPACKVEPKFKVGDWVINRTDAIIMQIVNNEDFYESVEIGGQRRTDTYNYAEWDFRLWTIKDAKDGDVLCSESGWTCIFKALDNHTNTFSSYCFMDSDKWFCNTGCTCHTLDEQFIRAYNFKLHPTTKEQRDTLIKAMANAGYTFDFKKKELKKIEQKPAWSEEDEEIVEALNNYIKNLDIFFSEIKIGDKDILSKEFREKVQPWLKSLKSKIQPQNN